MAKQKRKNIMIEDALIQFRNFSGVEKRYNTAGKRNFCVFLDDETCETLIEDGWNVKWLEPRDTADKRQGYLQVTVNYKNYPPNIVIITSRGKTILNEETVSMLDWAEFECVDLVVTPSDWDMNGKSGIKAYVKSMYVTLVEDKFEQKYYDVPDSAIDSVGGCGNCDACDGSCGCGGH